MVARSLKENMTPYEKWYDWKPNLAHLRVFGCMVMPMCLTVMGEES